eukprot:CAMPEP_0204623622 /NCGR_PEP_ID=MMETSP0717-20131115/9348_1 /ASSEMBLY_ACC=CAM_ASM_000666 /TAXON_ID=230516 /ORGANISM="Chaetoceros curvisetus" /LENGTH=286 /DNA_ID=CAMNT_0051638749 /DNA_START=122 /DNA_END=982 /DNA_ORIENTATION=+
MYDHSGGRNESSEVCKTCGYSAHLTSLIEHIHSKGFTNKGFSRRMSYVCPQCLNNITDIYDGVAHDISTKTYAFRTATICEKEFKKSNFDTVHFKYSKRSYHLAVLRSDSTKGVANKTSFFSSFFQKIKISSSDGSDWTLAQNRIAFVLGMNAKSSMKILFKGKVIYPDKSMGSRAISDKLIEISNQDPQDSMVGKSSKSSLVVMGTRMKEVAQIESHNTSKASNDQPSRFLLLGFALLVGMLSVSPVWRIVSDKFVNFIGKGNLEESNNYLNYSEERLIQEIGED